MIFPFAITGPTQPMHLRFPFKAQPPFSIPSKFAVALVLLALPVAMVRAQQPDVWPQDDDSGAQAQNAQPYQNPQPYGEPQQPYNYPQYPQSVPQQGNYGQPYQQPGYAPQPDYNQQAPAYMPAQALNAQQLEQLLAPIALYPDAVLAQILAGSTYPAQIAAADQWRRSMGAAPPDQVAAGANAQGAWDPSVKALTAYPQVLDMMNQDLQWTTALGNAYYNQPQDVMETIQVLRQRAQAAGNLQPTPQEQVTTDQGYISLAPTNPEVVYVPTYNPWVAYGQPIAAYPGYQPIDTIGAIVGAGVQFGLQFAVGAFMAPFNLFGWGLDWLGHAILFDHDVWCSRSGSVHDWGFPHGGPRAFRGGEWARYGGGYGRGGNGAYGHGGMNAYRNQPGYGGGYGGAGHYPVARPEQGIQNRYGGAYNRGANAPVRPGEGGNGFGHGNSGPARGFLGSGGTTHPAMPGQSYAYNRGQAPTPLGRPQPYGGTPQSYGYSGSRQFSNYGQRPGVGSGSFPRSMPGYGGGQGYRPPSEAYRAPTPSFGHGFSQPPARTFAGNSGHSGGFHPFGGGHNSAPSYGGGHSFSGGGGHSFFGGGGHSSGGGHSFGGGHSSGGHSGGGHSGGGGHGHHH